MSNNWTASTTTSWIFFDKDHTLTAITGTGGDSITIYVIPATEPTDVAKGSITIVTESGVIEKEIIRCVPKITGETKSLSCKINGCDFDDDDCTITVSPCVNGTGGNYNGINITDIVLTIIQNLSDGKTNKITQNLYLSDVDVTYTTEGNVTSTVLTENNGKARKVLVTVTYKNDRSVSIGPKEITQAGLIKENGDYDDTKFVKTGYSDSNVYYQNFNFNSNCRDYTTSSCQGGTFEFSCSGDKVTVYGGKTGKTICNKTVSIGGGDSQDSEPILSSDVSYSVSPEDGNYFTNNTLTYSSNENRSQNKSLTIYATLIPDNQTIQTTFTIVAGTDCGNPLYIQITSNKKAISFESETVEIRYYLTEEETGGEPNAVTDESIISCLNLSCPNGVNCGTQTVSNGVFKRTVTFPKNTSEEREGINWTFTATCESAENNPATLIIYQASKYENIIPNCDYFAFRYNWSANYNEHGVIISGDGDDLDSLTLINNLPELTDWADRKVSGLTVGYGGTMGTNSPVFKTQDRPFLKHGGDNTEAGAEGAIICLRNILESGQVSNEDIIWVDIYACWYGTRINGNMNIEFSQYTGLTENHKFSDEIRQNGYVFEPVENNCALITSSTSSNINVVAEGAYNFRIAQNVGTCLLGEASYDHVMRLKYNVASKVTSLEYPATKGINTRDLTQKAMYNGTEEYLSKTIYLDSSSHSIEYTNFYLRTVFNGATTSNYMFVDDDNANEYILIKFYENLDNKGEVYIRKADLGTTKSLYVINDILFTQNPDKTINFSFTIPEHSQNERNVEIEFNYNASGISTCGKAKGMHGSFNIYQNKKINNN